MDKPLQTPFQANLLKIHAVIVKVENVVFFPFRWLAESMTNTHIFRDYLKSTPKLKVVR